MNVLVQQAITWANVDPDLCCHVTSLGHSELKWIVFKHILQTYITYVFFIFFEISIGEYHIQASKFVKCFW